MKFVVNKEYEVWIIDPLYQKPSIFISLDKFILKGFFDKVVINMTPCFEFDDDDNKTNEKQNAKKAPPPKRDNKVLAILKALLAHMCWQQILHLSDEIREVVVVAIGHSNLYADKVKDVPLVSSPTQCATYNTTVTFVVDDLLLGSKPHMQFVTGYIRGQIVRRILVDGGSAVNICLSLRYIND